MSDKLRECPFCGGAGALDGEGHYRWNESYVHCTACRFVYADDFDSDEKAIAAWNQRSPSPRTSEKNIERRECLCEECGRDYEVWYAPNDIWNRVMRQEDREESGHEPFLCASCFMRRAASIEPVGWLVTPDPEPRVVLHFASQLAARAEPHPDHDFAETMARFTAEALEKKIADCAAELNRSIFEQTGCGLNALAAMHVLPILRKYFGTEGSI